ncbi:MAG: DUF1127 domain-containing protein [Rhizobiales bacterium]|nr:DUF1127 domain-containing protein [Hyphomicrobiales bacterium]
MTCSACLPVRPRSAATDTSPLQAFLDRAAHFVALGDWSIARIRTRRAVAGLSARQLADAGIDRSAVCRAQPVFEVKGGLIANLSSLQ